MNEIEATGHYLLVLNEVYKGRKLLRAIGYELLSTGYSLLNRLGRIPESMERSGHKLGLLSLGIHLEPDPRLFTSNGNFPNNYVPQRERELTRLKEEMRERIEDRINFILRYKKS